MKRWHIFLAVGLVTVVLLVWAGASTWRHIRRESMDKSVSSYQIRAALDQYFLEYPHAMVVGYGDLVGADKYLKALNPVDGEDYHELFPVHVGYRELAVTMRDGRRVILFDRQTLRQEADGSFSPRYNSDPAAVANYQRWLAAGRPSAN